MCAGGWIACTRYISSHDPVSGCAVTASHRDVPVTAPPSASVCRTNWAPPTALAQRAVRKPQRASVTVQACASGGVPLSGWDAGKTPRQTVVDARKQPQTCYLEVTTIKTMDLADLQPTPTRRSVRYEQFLERLAEIRAALERGCSERQVAEALSLRRETLRQWLREAGVPGRAGTRRRKSRRSGRGMPSVPAPEPTQPGLKSPAASRPLPAASTSAASTPRVNRVDDL